LSTYFLDTSALAKGYLVETGSTWIENLIAPSAGHIIVICDLTPIEFFSMVARRQRENTLSNADKLTLETAFIVDVDRTYLTITLDSSVLVPAREFVGKYILRPPDAIQLASALYAKTLLNEPITFLCADQNLLAAAQAEGLPTDNPNLHP
jgi:uncharacterized protein